MDSGPQIQLIATQRYLTKIRCVCTEPIELPVTTRCGYDAASPQPCLLSTGCWEWPGSSASIPGGVWELMGGLGITHIGFSVPRAPETEGGDSITLLLPLIVMEPERVTRVSLFTFKSRLLQPSSPSA